MFSINKAFVIYLCIILDLFDLHHILIASYIDRMILTCFNESY